MEYKAFMIEASFSRMNPFFILLSFKSIIYLIALGRILVPWVEFSAQGLS